MSLYVHVSLNKQLECRNTVYTNKTEHSNPQRGHAADLLDSSSMCVMQAVGMNDSSPATLHT
jgi:hypothetical protein